MSLVGAAGYSVDVTGGGGDFLVAGMRDIALFIFRCIFSGEHCSDCCLQNVSRHNLHILDPLIPRFGFFLDIAEYGDVHCTYCNRFS